MIRGSVSIRDDRLVFEGTSESVADEIQRLLRHRYTRRLFVQDFHEAPDDSVLLKLGTAYPKDVSDSRGTDDVMKFVNVGGVETLRAEQTGPGHYAVSLPDRDALYDAFQTRREEMLNHLDWTTAKAIFEAVYDLDPVRNQLNSVVQIVKYLHEEVPLAVERLDRIQGQANTEGYLRVLSDFDFVRIDDGAVFPGEKIEAVESTAPSYDEYERRVVGQIVADAYYVLREELDLRMLSHFPKYANAYYFSAVQKGDPDLHLDTETVRRNLATEWDDDVDPLVLNEKVDQLESADVLRRDGEFVTGTDEVYESVSDGASEVAVAD
ncbi:hypothetical protein RYH80_09265 [Halobaculum sp. MBLA0147]|uniref:hypothetical protein n=1 Tax=Halobaculum sp. MBLA0147 TaxID=3079934 RepID=UPI0035253B76